MAAPDAPPEVTELIYVPEPSWHPALIAVGLAAILAGIFMGWFYAAVGLVFFLVGLVAWVRDVRDSMERLPRRQVITSAVIPAAPMRRAARAQRD